MNTAVPFVSWEKTYPCQGNAVTWFNHVLPLDDGGLLAVGYTRFDMNSLSDQSLYYVKIKANGEKVWGYEIGPPGAFSSSSAFEARSAIQTETGSFWIVGREFHHSQYLKSRCYLLLVDSDGKKMDDYPIYGTVTGPMGPEESYTEGYSIVRTFDGGFVIAGITNMEGQKTLGFNVPGEKFLQMFLVKRKAGNLPDWWRCYGYKGNDRAFVVRQTKDNGYVLAGYRDDVGKSYYVQKVQQNGDPEWDHAIYQPALNDQCAHSVEQLDNKGYVVGCSTDKSGSLCVLNPDGAEVNRIDFKVVADYTRPFLVLRAKEGGFIVTGANGNGAYLAKMDAAFEKSWEGIFGGPGNYLPRCTAQTSNGGYAIAGAISEAGQPDRCFLIKIDLLDAAIKHAEKPAIFQADVVTGKPFAVTVTMKNNGTTAWANSGSGSKKILPSIGHSFGLMSLPGDAEEFGEVFERIPDQSKVPPGKTREFKFKLKAPKGGGAYHPEYMMVRKDKPSPYANEKLTFFGEKFTLDINVVK